MRKLGRQIAPLLLAVSLFVTACGGGAKAPEGGGGETPPQTPQNPAVEGKPTSLKLTGEVDDSKTLTTLINIEPPPAFHGNPYDDVAGLNWSVQPFLFGRLAFYSPLPERDFKPALLESFKQEGDTLTIVLKEGLKWSDGSPLTIDDVMTNYYIAISKGTIWQVAHSIEKVDEKTIKIEFVNSSPLNMNLALNQYVMANEQNFGEIAAKFKEYADEYRFFDEATGRYKYRPEGDETMTALNQELADYKPDPLKDVLFSGPYTLTNVTSAEASFEVNPNYQIQPKIKKIRGLRSGGQEAFATAVMQQEFTVENGGLSPQMHAEVLKKFEDTIRTIYIPEFSQMGFMFNTQKAPFDNPTVRKAFALLMDRETLITVGEPGSFISDTHATAMLPSLIDNYTNPGFIDSLADYSFNPEKAEELLNSIGWQKVGGKWQDENGQAVKVEIATIGAWPSLMYPAEAYATMLEEEGFEIDFKPMEPAAVSQYMADGEHQIAMNFMPGMAGYQHPWEVFNNMFNGVYATRMNLPKLEPGQDRIVKAPTSGKEYNVTEMLAKIYATTDEKELKQLTEDFMTLTNDLVNAIPLIEKTAPFRIYDTKLSLAEGVLDQPQNSFYYYDNINTILAKLILDGELFFVK